MKKQYLYQTLPDERDKSVLKIKNPEKGKGKIEVDYFRKKAFRDFCNSEKEYEVSGYTKFKLLKERDEASDNKVLFLQGHKYLIEEKKHLFNRVKGYIRVEDITEENEEAGSDTTCFVAVTRFAFVSLLPLLLLLLIILLFAFCGRGGKLPTESSQWNPIIEQNTDEASTEAASSVSQIKISGFTDWYVPEGQTENLSIKLQNPEDNPCYFSFDIILTETGETIYQSDMVPPGKSLNSISIAKPLAAGTYPAVVYITTNEIETGREMNSAKLNINITVS